MISTIASERRQRRLGSDVAREVLYETARHDRRTRHLRTFAYLCALLLVGLGTSATLPVHRYDYVLGTHAAHPEVAYSNTLAVLQAL